MVSSIYLGNDDSDSCSEMRQQRRRGLHFESSRNTRVIAVIAAAALVCLSRPQSTFASSRHIPESGYGSRSARSNRFQPFAPRNNSRDPRMSPTSAIGALGSHSSPASMSSSSLRLSSMPEEDNQIPSSSSHFNSTLDSGSATEGVTRVTTTSFFQFPSETLKQPPSQEPLELRLPATIIPRRYRLTTTQVQTRFVISLMGIAGFIEGFCSKRHGCFPNLMTGTILKIAEALGNGNFHVAGSHASMVGCYIGGSWVYAQWKKDADLSGSKPEQKKSILKAVSVLSGFVLILSDISVKSMPSLRLPLLAGAFGIINSGTVDVGAGVTFAMTGHSTRVGKGLATGSVTKPSADRTSAQGMVVFCVGAIGASLFCKFLQTKSSYAAPSWPILMLVGTVSEHLPFGITTAVVHTCLFRWYVRASAKASAVEAKMR